MGSRSRGEVGAGVAVVEAWRAHAADDDGGLPREAGVEPAASEAAAITGSNPSTVEARPMLSRNTPVAARSTAVTDSLSLARMAWLGASHELSSIVYQVVPTLFRSTCPPMASMPLGVQPMASHSGDASPVATSSSNSPSPLATHTAVPSP